MAEFPALPLWTDAYLGDTTHLTTIEHGAYLLLLFTAWRTPTYDLPDDDKLLAKFCRLTAGQWLRIKPTVMAYWRLQDSRWSNGRLLDERDAVRRKVAQRSDAGRSSALKRLNRAPTDVQRNVHENSTSKATATATATATANPEEDTSLREVSMPKRKSRRSIPDNFPFKENLDWSLDFWLKKGRADLCSGIDDEVEKFRDHHSGKLTASADWPGSWRTWTRNAIKFSNGTHNGRRKPTPHENFAEGALLAAQDAIARRQRGN